MTAHFLAALAARHEVALLSIRAPGEPASDPAVVEQCALYEEVPESTGGWGPLGSAQRAWRMGMGLLVGRPPWISGHRSPRFVERARELIEQWKPEIIQVEWIMMGQYLAALDSSAAPRVLTHHEPRAQAIREQPWPASERARIVRPILHPLYLRAWDRFERQTMAQVRAIVVFTERDRAALQPSAPQTIIRQIPLGVEIPELPLSPIGASPPSIVFVGNFWHPPNVDAARRLIDRIVPLIRLELPELQLYLVGPHLPDEIRQTAGPGIVVTGRVPEVTPYLDQAAVVVAPLFVGGGMRVKVLDALAAGKAVVASTRATEGLDLRPGEHLLIADTDEDFARSVIEVVRDPERRQTLATQGRAWIAEHLGWVQTVEAYERLYDELLSSPYPPGA